MESVALQEVEKIGGERIGVAAVRDAGRETADGNRTWTIEFSNKKELTGVPTAGEAATVEVTRLKPPSTHTILKWIYGVNEHLAIAKGFEVEYIVVDGGSTDGTVDIIRDFEKKVLCLKSQVSSFKSQVSSLKPQASSLQSQVSRPRPGHGCNLVFRWISEKDRGMYDALNKGIAMATGNVIGILNADDRLDGEDVLADVAEAFECCECSSDEKNTLDAIFGDVRFVRGESRETVRYYSSKPWKAWMHYWGYMPAHPTMYVRREVFELFDSHRIWILAGRGWRKVGGSSKKC